jgi:hypothetical protein
VPELISSSAINLASLTGIAKPIPVLVLCEEELPEESSEAMAELMASSWPPALIRAPPLLPRLIAALVYIVLETTGRRSAGWAGG